METLGHGASTSVGPRHDTAAKASMIDLAALYPMASMTCKSEPTKPNERCSTEITAKAQTCSTAVAPPLNVYSLPRCDRTGNGRGGLMFPGSSPQVWNLVVALGAQPDRNAVPGYREARDRQSFRPNPGRSLLRDQRPPVLSARRRGSGRPYE